jgi:hypothetical protein
VPTVCIADHAKRTNYVVPCPLEPAVIGDANIATLALARLKDVGGSVEVCVPMAPGTATGVNTGELNDVAKQLVLDALVAFAPPGALDAGAGAAAGAGALGGAGGAGGVAPAIGLPFDTLRRSDSRCSAAAAAEWSPTVHLSYCQPFYSARAPLFLLPGLPYTLCCLPPPVLCCCCRRRLNRRYMFALLTTQSAAFAASAPFVPVTSRLRCPRLRRPRRRQSRHRFPHHRSSAHRRPPNSQTVTKAPPAVRCATTVARRYMRLERAIFFHRREVALSRAVLASMAAHARSWRRQIAASPHATRACNLLSSAGDYALTGRAGIDGGACSLAAPADRGTHDALPPPPAPPRSLPAVV